eukprot:51803-Pyramimonas_sp.AAC.1
MTCDETQSAWDFLDGNRERGDLRARNTLALSRKGSAETPDRLPHLAVWGQHNYSRTNPSTPR